MYFDKAEEGLKRRDHLSYSSKEANALRFESADIAGEVLELQVSADLPEQMCIEE